jgi:WD40 repeat protein
VLALLPVEGLVVSGGADGAVKVWRLATSAVLRVLAGHEGGVRAIQLLPASESSYARRAHAVRSEATAADSGAHVLTCGEDKHLRYWNISSGLCAMTFAGHAVGVLSCAACTALDMVAGGARDVLCAPGVFQTARSSRWFNTMCQ